MFKNLFFSLFLVLGFCVNAQEDCTSAIALCGNSNINYTPSGIGNVNENLGSCLSGEHHSVWYKFTIATSGTLTFDLVPTGPVDYDWAIYGPNASCNNLGNAIRCNASGFLTSTGMNLTNTNTTSGGGNTNPYCRYMDVVAGQTYYLYIDNWSTTVYTFNLTWGGTATFVSPFNSSTLAPNPFIPPGSPGASANAPSEVPLCNNSSVFDFATLSSGILNGNQNFVVSYYLNANDAATGNNPITSPINVNTNSTYYYSISYNNPTAPVSSCKQIKTFVFKSTSVTASISGSSSSICYGGNVVLTSSSSTGNVWSTGATTPSITVSNGGTYSLTVSNGSCTSPPASITIAQESDPSLQISGNLVLCESSSTTLTASSSGNGNTYVWSTGATTPSINVSSAGTYTVTMTTASGCQYTKSVNVSQGVVPVAQNASLSICSNASSTIFNLTLSQPNISTTPGVTYDYYASQIDALAGNMSTIANPTAYMSGNATIYVRVKSATCSKVVSLQLIISSLQPPTISSSSSSICYGGNVVLTSSSSTGNVWSTGATTPSITVSNGGTYSLTVSNGSCTSPPASITIAQESDPSLQISGNLVLCESSSTTLTASSSGNGNTYVWSTGATTPSINVSSAGTYTVTMTTASGCQYTKSVNVVMSPLIVVNINLPGQINCTNSQINLDASSSVYQTGSVFQWVATGGGVILGGGSTLTPTVSDGGTYTLTITSPNGCTKQGSTTVVKNFTAPNIVVTASKLTICLGESVNLSAVGAATYNWSGLSGNSGSQVVSPSVTTTYSVSGIGLNGCASENIATVTIKVVPPISSILQDIEFCKGDKGFLDAGANPNYTYVWSTGETTSSINVFTDGTYSVTISNGGCSKTYTATVGYTLTPKIKEIIYDNNLLTIVAQNNGSLPLEYSIDAGVTWQNSNVFGVFRNTQYEVRVRNRGATCATTVNYYTFYIANVITPNYDGRNDAIDFSEISKYRNFSGIIFDKYGKTIFRLNKENSVWDGKYLGRPLPTDTYWFTVTWEDKPIDNVFKLSGWILLKNRE